MFVMVLAESSHWGDNEQRLKSPQCGHGAHQNRMAAKPSAKKILSESPALILRSWFGYVEGTELVLTSFCKKRRGTRTPEAQLVPGYASGYELIVETFY